jgi:CspA family cold shock protein
MAMGTVKWFNATKGYGFIRLDEVDKDAFVHISKVERSGIGRLTEGQRIAFQIKEDTRELRAIKLEATEA